MGFLQSYFFPASTFGRKIFGKYGTLVFGFDFLGKNIFDKLFGPYSKKPPWSPGEGVQGRGSPGVLPGLYKKSPRAGVEFSFPGAHPKLHISTGLSNSTWVFPTSLASQLRLCFKKGAGGV